MKKDSKNEKKPPSMSKVIGVIVLIWYLTGFIYESDYFSRMPGGMGLAIFIAALIVIFVVIIVKKIIKMARDNKDPSAKSSYNSGSSKSIAAGSSYHSHDRLDPSVKRETGVTHWKKQLDDLLEAGIITKSEYRVLFEKHKKDYEKSNNLY